MIRTSSHSLLRSISYRATAPQLLHSSRRYLSNSSTHYGPRSWKGSVARWLLVGGAVYYYNTSNVFAEEPFIEDVKVQFVSEKNHNMPTVDQAVQERRKRAEATVHTPPSPETSEHDTTIEPTEDAIAQKAESPDELEEEAESEGAFNPETGEINWDCPCLGGMAHGPCGEEFKAAFSCFVHSEQEPKGMDCIEKFKGMQNCFRQHPDVYGEELDDEDAAEEESENASPVAAASHNELSDDKSASSAPEISDNKPYMDQKENLPQVES